MGKREERMAATAKRNQRVIDLFKGGKSIEFVIEVTGFARNRVYKIRSNYLGSLPSLDQSKNKVASNARFLCFMGTVT